jgi:hypothetical protein
MEISILILMFPKIFFLYSFKLGDNVILEFTNALLEQKLIIKQREVIND